jgi:diguanylate cyclase (GGDEF)-like protein
LGTETHALSAGKGLLTVGALATLLAIRLALADAGLVLDAVVAVLAGIGAWNASRLSRRPRSTRAWRWQMLVPLVWAIAPVIWLFDGPEVIANAARVAAVLCAATAWWLVSYAVDTWSRVRLVIDGGLAAGSFFVVTWQPVLRDAWSESGGGPEGVLCLAAPLGAVWAATFLVGLMLTEMHGSHRLMPALFVAALLVTAASDVALMVGSTPVWALGWALALVAVRTYRGTSGRREVFSTKLIVASVPYLVIAPAMAAFVLRGLDGTVTSPDIWAGRVMVALLLVRQHVTLAENRMLVNRLAVTERLLRHQATHDHLTGLAGRVLLWERLETVATEASGVPFDVAVIFVDLDGFKLINDEHGHATGDHVLVETARRLKRSVEVEGDNALVVRISGDEFAVLLLRSAAQRHAAISALLLAEIQHPIDVNGSPLAVGASLGVAVSTTDLLSPSALLRGADAAMYRVKHSGKGGVGVAGDATSSVASP